jgi:hypothetical protein
VLDFDAYRSWWPWLVEFDPPPLTTGAATRAVVRAPARYRLRLDLTLTEVVAPERVVIAVAGDVVGQATVTVTSAGPSGPGRRPRSGDTGTGSEVTLRWSLEPSRRLLRALDVVARPVLVRGHDRILDDGFRRCLAATGLDLVSLAG